MINNGLPEREGEMSWGGGVLEEVEVDRMGVDDEVKGTEEGRFGKALEGRVGQPEQRSRRVHHSSTAGTPKPTQRTNSN